MSDQHITCSECGSSFVFTEAEQKFYDTKGLAGPPKRCKACRQARKAAEAARGGGGRKGGRDEASPWAPRARGPEARGSGHPTRDRAPAPREATGGWGRMGGDDRPRRPERARPEAARPERARREVREVEPGGFRPRRPGKSSAKSATGKVEPATSPAAAKQKKKAERQKFDVTCVQCGAATQVPFKPIEGRDIFCQPCYRARLGAVVPTPTPAGPDGADS